LRGLTPQTPIRTDAAPRRCHHPVARCNASLGLARRGDSEPESIGVAQSERALPPHVCRFRLKGAAAALDPRCDLIDILGCRCIAAKRRSFASSTWRLRALSICALAPTDATNRPTHTSDDASFKFPHSPGCSAAHRSVRRGSRATNLSLTARHGAGVRPWRRMTSPIFARSGGPPAAALITSAASRKNCGPIAAGVITPSAFASSDPLLTNR
jgi:hypothetical protein